MPSVSVAQVLAVCVRAALAAQRYVMLDLVKLPQAVDALTSTHGRSPPAPYGSPPLTVLDLPDEDRRVLMDSLRRAVHVDVKARLDYKEADAADDLVTTADVLTQAVVMLALTDAFPDFPFTVIGEEDQPSSEVAAQAADCWRRYYEKMPIMPYESVLQDHVRTFLRPGTDAGDAVVLYADSVEALRCRLAIFVDPIDGTNCFVGGVWPAPMTLVGIAVDGVPVGGVLNRIFCFPLPAAAAPASEISGKASQEGEPADMGQCVPSLSVVLHMPALSSPFVIFDGELVPAPIRCEPHPICGDRTAFGVCRSSTTKESFLGDMLPRLAPCESVCVRGAGYKLYHLLRRMLKGRAIEQERIIPADVFIAPPSTIKKWDCCAAHAFLLALQGEIYTQDGEPLRYPMGNVSGDTQSSLSDVAALPRGLIAVTPYAHVEVARRLGFRSPVG